MRRFRAPNLLSESFGLFALGQALLRQGKHNSWTHYDEQWAKYAVRLEIAYFQKGKQNNATFDNAANSRPYSPQDIRRWDAEIGKRGMEKFTQMTQQNKTTEQTNNNKPAP